MLITKSSVGGRLCPLCDGIIDYSGQVYVIEEIGTSGGDEYGFIHTKAYVHKVATHFVCFNDYINCAKVELILVPFSERSMREKQCYNCKKHLGNSGTRYQYDVALKTTNWEYLFSHFCVECFEVCFGESFESFDLLKK